MHEHWTSVIRTCKYNTIDRYYTQLLELTFLHTRHVFPRFSPVLTNLILHTLIRPVGRIKTNKYEHWLYRRSRNSVAKTLKLTSHTTSTFNMADINVKQYDLFMAAPTLKSVKIKCWRSKGMQEKESIMRIETSVPRNHCLALFGKASWFQTVTLGRIFLSAPHTHETFL